MIQVRDIFLLHKIYILLNTRKPQVIQGGGGVRTPCTLPLDTPLFIWGHNCFCYRAILQVLIAAVSFVIVCKELTLPQTAQIHQLFNL